MPPNPATRPNEALFPKLSGGPRQLPAAAVARHQRSRLQGAMVEAVARHGYLGTTLTELVALAGVSRSTFYEHFESKQECFLSTFDQIASLAIEQIGHAYGGQGDFRQRLRAGLSRLMELAVQAPEAAALLAVDSMTVGEAGIDHRERAAKPFECMLRADFDAKAAGRSRVSDATIMAVVAGIGGVLYRRLRAGQERRLPGDVEELVEWVLGYQGADCLLVERAVRAAREPAEEEGGPGGEGPGEDRVAWSEPPDSTLSRAELGQRERILRAAARVVVEQGYEALTIPAISAAAGVSNQTFYTNFTGKREAFLAAYEIIGREALAVTTAAFEREGDRAEAIALGLRAALAHIGSNRVFGRLAFFEAQSAGMLALNHSDTLVDSFTAFLEPGVAPTELGGPLSWVARQAVGAGIWSLIQHEIAHNGVENLPQLAPELTRIALAPFGAS